MPLKLNISEKEKSWKLEVPTETLSGKVVGEKVNGKTIKPELEGYEFEISGGSDISGFPMSKDVEGVGLKKLLLTKGWGMWSKPKGLKKKKTRVRGGLRLRKTVRGKVISEKVIQVNLKVTKSGQTPLAKVFPEQNAPKQVEAPTEAPTEKSEE